MSLFSCKVCMQIRQPDYPCRLSGRRALLVFLALACACSDSPADPRLTDTAPVTLEIIGRGTVSERATTEVWAHGNYAYTATGPRAGSGGTVPGNAIKVWNVSGNTPVLVDSVI